MKRKEEVSDDHQHAEMMIHWTDSTKRRERKCPGSLGGEKMS
jgi:hypothetical protein